MRFKKLIKYDLAGECSASCWCRGPDGQVGTSEEARRLVRGVRELPPIVNFTLKVVKTGRGVPTGTRSYHVRRGTHVYSILDDMNLQFELKDAEIRKKNNTIISCNYQPQDGDEILIVGRMHGD